MCVPLSPKAQTMEQSLKAVLVLEVAAPTQCLGRGMGL